MENAHIKESGDVLSYFGVTEDTGLSPEQVKKNLNKYGYNGEGDKKGKRWMDGWPEEITEWRTGDWKESVLLNEMVEDSQD